MEVLVPQLLGAAAARGHAAGGAGEAGRHAAGQAASPRRCAPSIASAASTPNRRAGRSATPSSRGCRSSRRVAARRCPGRPDDLRGALRCELETPTRAPLGGHHAPDLGARRAAPSASSRCWCSIASPARNPGEIPTLHDRRLQLHARLAGAPVPHRARLAAGARHLLARRLPAPPSALRRLHLERAQPVRRALASSATAASTTSSSGR